MGIVKQALAQKMVNYIVRIIGRNVNIMDEHGTIIASADSSRIGQSHEKAVKAIQNDRIEIVVSDGDGMKKGVNIPIHYHDQICGVVGVSGDVKEIKQIIDLVRCSIELLIEQEAMMNIQQVRKQLREQFLYEWIYRQVSCSPSFISRGDNCGVSVKVPRRVMIVRLEKSTPENLLENYYEDNEMDDYCIRLSSTLHILILNALQSEDTQFETVFRLAPTAKISIGEIDEVINNSLIQAHAAMKIGEMLFPQDVVFRYSRFRYIEHILRGRTMLNMSGRLLENTEGHMIDNIEYLNTLLEYFRQNGHLSLTANILHIHRNTLKYRLERIYQITGLCPQNYLDLFHLVCNYVIFCDAHKTTDSILLPQNS